jgi:hypothetical protein
MLPGALRLIVAVAAVFAVAALVAQIMRAYARGGKPVYARPQGSGARGIIYAFGRGMLPWEKESAAKHLFTYLGGVLYHLSILAAFVILAAVELASAIPPIIVLLLQISMFVGLLCGLALLVKRASLGYMRAISNADDVVANLLVDLFVAVSLAVTLSAAYETAQLIVATLLLVYIPIGKIRHCAFFFYTRVVFGSSFGRRGVLPHRAARYDI